MVRIVRVASIVQNDLVHGLKHLLGRQPTSFSVTANLLGSTLLSGRYLPWYKSRAWHGHPCLVRNPFLTPNATIHFLMSSTRTTL